MQIQAAILEVMQADLKSAKPVRTWRPLDLGQAVHKLYPQINESTVRSQLSVMYEKRPGLLVRCAVRDKHGHGWEYRVGVGEGTPNMTSVEPLRTGPIAQCARAGAFDAALIPSMMTAPPNTLANKAINATNRKTVKSSARADPAMSGQENPGQVLDSRAARKMSPVTRGPAVIEKAIERLSMDPTVRERLQGEIARLREDLTRRERQLAALAPPVLDMMLRELTEMVDLFSHTTD